MKDWTGNGNSVFKNLGSSHHTETDREENDYYATEPRAAELLLKLENFDECILEPSCGQGHLSKVFEAAGHYVQSSDLIDRGFGTPNVNFFDVKSWDGDIITNPPYKYAGQFIEHALNIIPENSKVPMFLKVQFLEGKTRRLLFEKYPPIRVWVSSSRINCAINGDFEGLKMTGGSAVAYAWFVWKKGFKGETVLKWFN